MAHQEATLDSGDEDIQFANSGSFKLPLSNYTGTSYVETLSNSGTVGGTSPAWFTNWSFASRVKIVHILTFYTFIVSSIGKNNKKTKKRDRKLTLQNNRDSILSLYCSY